MNLPSIVEALLIASDEALPTKKIVSILKKSLPTLEDEINAKNITALRKESLEDQRALLSDLSPQTVEHAIEALNMDYEKHTRSLQISKTHAGWRVYTRPEYAIFLEQLSPPNKPQKLSRSAIETLAIIAYRQPTSKAEIEAIRGVASDSMIQKLLKLDLIKVAGRSEALGKPLIYSVTDFFLAKFGIEALKDLPNYEELTTALKDQA